MSVNTTILKGSTMAVEWIVAYLALGALVGFMAGLLGIGGGGIMVPVLTSLFAAQGIPRAEDYVPPAPGKTPGG